MARIPPSLVCALALAGCSGATTTVVHRDGSRFEAIVTRADAERLTLRVPSTGRTVNLRRTSIEEYDLPGDGWASVGATAAIVGLAVMSEGLISGRDGTRVFGYGALAVAGAGLAWWGMWRYHVAYDAWMAGTDIIVSPSGVTMRF